jgi:cell division protease FtsH
MPQKDSVPKKKPQIQPNKKKNIPKFNYLWLYAIAIIGLLFFMQNPGSNSVSEEIASTKLERLIVNKDIESVLYIQKDSRVNIFLKEKSVKTKAEFDKFREKNLKGPHYFITISDFSVFNTNVKDIQDRAVQKYLKANPEPDETQIRSEYIFDIKQDMSRSWGIEIFWFILMGILIIFIFSSFRGIRGGGPGGIFNIGKSRAQLFDSKSNNGASFKDVAGMEGAKYEVEEIVDFLKNPKKYTE